MPEAEYLSMVHQFDQQMAAILEEAESTLQMDIEGNLLKDYFVPGGVAVDAAIAYMAAHDQPGLDRESAWEAIHEVVLDRVREAKEDPDWVEHLMQRYRR